MSTDRQRRALRRGLLLILVLTLVACTKTDTRAARTARATAGDRAAQADLAQDLLEGRDGPRDVALGRQWLARAAQAGDAPSALDLARRLAAEAPPALRGRVRDLLEQAVAAAPDDAEAQDALANLLATHPEADAADGARAVLLLEARLRAAAEPETWRMELLAAAYARAGRRFEAVGAERFALVGLDCECERKLADAHRRRIALYARGETWNESLL